MRSPLLRDSYGSELRPSDCGVLVLELYLSQASCLHGLSVSSAWPMTTPALGQWDADYESENWVHIPDRKLV